MFNGYGYYGIQCKSKAIYVYAYWLASSYALLHNQLEAVTHWLCEVQRLIVY